MASRPPAFRDGFVRRQELVHDLIDARGSLLALIVAPAGYGKSTLLADWADRDDRPFIWLSLRSDAAQRSLHRSMSHYDELAQDVRQISLQHESFVLVIDDAHQIPGAMLCDLLEPALAALPQGSTIALASRTEPSLPIGRLRAHRVLSEIRTPQLAMTAPEAAALVRHAGFDPGCETTQELVRRTEGWPAALYLAALAAGDEPDGIDDFGGHHHLLTEYVRDEVLGSMPAHVLLFCEYTSVLDELSGPVCDAVLERRGSAEIIAKLARTNTLLEPLDVAHHSFRWHSLMRDALTSELRRNEPALEPVLRRRASRWYSAHGDPQRAIAQTAAAGDAKRTGDLLWNDILSYLTSGRRDLVAGWLGNLPADRITENAPLALSASLTALLAGDVSAAKQWSLAATAQLERRRPGQQRRSLAIGLQVIEAVNARGGLDGMARTAMAAAESEPHDSLWRPFCLLLGAVATYLRGDHDGAQLLLDEGAARSGSRTPIITSLCVAERAMIAIEREEWELAAELTNHATILLEEWELCADPLSAIVYAAAAASRAHHGRIDEAKHDLRRGIDLLATLGDFVPWYGAQARILLAHASLSLADAVGARALLAEASRLARRTPDAVIFARWFDRAWGHLDTLAETSLAGPSSLTIAELRILRFLPSHRSFREIASQLGVSANTVKTQAHAVYRKLGAASRSEAVAHAIDAGLLWQ